MWKASAVSAAPDDLGVDRRAAGHGVLADSTTMTPAPSPKRKPSRVRSNGREACSGSSLRFDSAPMLASAAKAIGEERRLRAAREDDVALAALDQPQRVLEGDHARRAGRDLGDDGPGEAVLPSTPGQAAIEPDSAGMANGLTWPGPLSRIVSAPSMTCSIPPPLVLTATATRSRCSGLIARSRCPSRSTASVPAAMPRWMNRLIRRAILRSIVDVGSKPLTSAAIRTSKPVGSKVVIGPPPDAGKEVAPERLGVVADRRDGAQAGDDGASGEGSALGIVRRALGPRRSA